jgi:ferredoxin
MMKIVAGSDHLASPSVLEDKVLKENYASASNRLACQAQVLDGHIVVRPG